MEIREEIQEIEENLKIIFDIKFNEAYKEKIDLIFSKLKDDETSDIFSELMSDIQETFYNHGKDTQKFFNKCFK